jgi:hypothetical protein
VDIYLKYWNQNLICMWNFICSLSLHPYNY